MPSPRKDRLQKLTLQKKELQQEVLMYRNIMESMRQHHALEEIYKLIIHNVTQGLGFDRAGLFLVNETGKLIELVMGIDAKGNYEVFEDKIDCSPIQGTHLYSDIVHGYVPWSMTNNVKKTVSKEVYERDFLGAVTSCAQVPIKVDKNKTIGVLSVDTLFSKRKLTKANLESLLNFATQAGLAIESFRLHSKVLSLTIMDPLTGVYNRRYFDEVLEFEYKRAARHTRSVGLLYADLDHFKKINDRWGHNIGDEVLKQAAHTLRAGVRNIDIVTRIGGEEFAIILPEMPLERTREVAARLVRTVAKTVNAAMDQPVTLSVGVASYPETGKDAKSLMISADKSLYEAKRNGRNQVGSLVLA